MKPDPEYPEYIDPKMGLFTVILQIILVLIGIIASIVLQSCGPLDIGKGKDPTALEKYKQAFALYSDGRYEDAAKILEHLSTYYPATILRGRALFFIHNHREAETALRKALNLRPSSVEGRLYLAYVLRASGKEEEARKLAEDILVDDPENYRAYRILADLAETKSATLVYLNQALEGLSEVALLFVERSRLRWAAGDGDGALEDLGAALTLIPGESALRSPVLALQNSITSQWQEQGR